MAKYNNIERKLIKLFDCCPGLRAGIKFVYQYICYFLNKKNYQYKLYPGLKLQKDSDKRSFWGYYDKSPEREGKILYHRFKTTGSTALVDIMLDNEKISESKTWNWQQGAMTTWLDDENIIHNDFDGDKYISKIVNIKTKNAKIVDFPVYAVSKDGKFALSLNFSRLARLRPDYGYFNRDFAHIPRYDENDGIYKIDPEKNRSDLIVSFRDLAGFKPVKSMEDAWHKVNHIDIASDNKRFIFLHRWFATNGKKYSRLITADTDGKNLYCLAGDEMVSHACWKDNNKIVCRAEKENLGEKYFLFTDRTEDFEIIGEGILTEDGHPSVNGKWLLTDTYPDKSRMSRILLFDMENSELIEIGEFFCPIEYYGQIRCDLHPRWGLDRNSITFDAVFEGERSIYKIDLTGILKERQR